MQVAKKTQTPMIVARGLTKKYEDFVAVDGIDFVVNKGESFGLLGPNGAGKSTTMRMIASTSQRTGGELTILGKDPNKHGPEIRAHLGVVPQQDNHDGELKAWENLYIYGRYFGLSRAFLKIWRTRWALQNLVDSLCGLLTQTPSADTLQQLSHGRQR